MIDRHFPRGAGRLTHRVYTLQPARSLVFRLSLWAFVSVSWALVGAAAVAVGHARRGSEPPAQCTVTPVDRSAQQIELTRARLALAEESAARAAVQKTAESATADVARLDAQVQFLRGQSKGRPPARADVPRR